MIRKSILTKTFLLFCSILSLCTFFPIYCDDLCLEEDIVSSSMQETSSTIDTNLLELNSRSCIVLDRLSKNILYGKNEKNKVKMASTTKIMTAIVVLENCSLDKTVEVSKNAAGTGGSRLGLKTGDTITIRDLLFGLLLCSGNDSSVA